MRKILIGLFLFGLLFSSLVYADNTLPRDKGGKDVVIQVMTIQPECFIEVSAGNIAVKANQVMCFSADLIIYEGDTATITWPYRAGTPIGIGEGVTSIHISANCVQWLMK